MRINGGELTNIGCGNSCEQKSDSVWRTAGLSTQVVRALRKSRTIVDIVAHIFRTLSTPFAHVLHIETLPNVVNLFTHNHIELAISGNFLHRMHRRRVVFSPQFARDIWKAHF